LLTFHVSVQSEALCLNFKMQVIVYG